LPIASLVIVEVPSIFIVVVVVAAAFEVSAVVVVVTSFVAAHLIHAVRQLSIHLAVLAIVALLAILRIAAAGLLSKVLTRLAVLGYLSRGV
jgi:hypothetical protein